MNKILSNIHLHTIFSDGSNTVEEYVLSAIEKGYVSIGISDHAPMDLEGFVYNPKDFDYCLLEKNFTAYIEEVRRVAFLYSDKIEVYLGIEEDYLPHVDLHFFDYTIGSVHNLITPNYHVYTIDHTEECFEQAVKAFGSAQALVEEYYRQLVVIAKVYQPDILAHFDIIGKLNWNHKYFKTTSKWYQKLVTHVVDEIKEVGTIVEINTGGLRKTSRQEQYPSKEIIQLLFQANVPLILSSDAHKVEELDTGFKECIQLLKQVGYKSVKRLQNKMFVDVRI